LWVAEQTGRSLNELTELGLLSEIDEAMVLMGAPNADLAKRLAGWEALCMAEGEHGHGHDHDHGHDHGHDAKTRLSDAEIFDLPPETASGLTFHLPMEILALRDAGASTEIINQRVDEQLGAGQAEGLTEPPMYRWAVARYQETARNLLSGHDHLAVHDIEPLAEGLAGAAFHGLIRFGYGAWHRDQHEIARGLAYLRTRRQVLAAPSAARAFPRQTIEVDSSEVSDSGASIARANIDLPGAQERNSVTVFDLLNLAAGTGLCSAPNAHQADTPRALALAAMALVRRNPSSFTAVHAATGFHALCEAELLMSGVAPSQHEMPGTTTKAWWTAYAIALRACTLLVESGPPDALPGYDDGYGIVTDIESLVAASIRSADTHDVKLAVALRRLVGFGLLSNAEATEVGIARLAAEQLT
jgi:hypothetical protein